MEASPMDQTYHLVSDDINVARADRGIGKVKVGILGVCAFLGCGLAWLGVQRHGQITEPSPAIIMPSLPSIASSALKDVSHDDYIKVFGINGPHPEHVGRLVNASGLQMASLHGQVDVNKDADSHAIYQGQLGDCYFDATLAAIAHKHPDKIVQMFTYINVAEGVFETQWFVAGRFEKVRINAFVPTSSDGIPFFLWTSSQLTLWPAILEKSYAKIMGNYKAIEGGWPREVMHYMFGVPVDTITDTRWNAQWSSISGASSLEDVWNKITQGIRNDFPIGIGTQAGGYHGIAGGHAYTLYDVSANYQGHGRSVRIRNPWGSNHYAGDIRGQDNLIGDVWITWDEFHRNFVSINIGHFYQSSSVRGYWNVPLSNGVAKGYATLTTKESKPFSVQVAWPSSRMTKAAHCPDISLSSFHLTMYRKGQQQSAVRGWRDGDSNMLRVDADGAGEWIVELLAVGNFGNLPEISLSVYAPTSTSLGQLYHGVWPSDSTTALTDFRVAANLHRAFFTTGHTDSNQISAGKCAEKALDSGAWAFMYTQASKKCSISTGGGYSYSYYPSGDSTILYQRASSMLLPDLPNTTNEASINSEVPIELVSCSSYYQRLKTGLGGSVLPSDGAFPESVLSIADPGVDCGDSAHGYRKPCSDFNHWQSMVTVADQMNDGLQCMSFAPHGNTCSVFNSKCNHEAMFFCKIVGCSMTMKLKPGWGSSNAAAECCGCANPANFR